MMKGFLQPSLFEQVTARRLGASKSSDLCPACGAVKAKGQVFCALCLGNLTPDLASNLHLSMDEGGDRAFIDAMRHLGRNRILTPDDKPLENVHRVVLSQLTAEHCAASAQSTICPKCGVSRKPLGAALCYVCVATFGTAIVGQARRKRFDGNQRFESLMRSIDPAALKLAPDEYIHALRIVFRYMRCPVFRVIFLED